MHATHRPATLELGETKQRKAAETGGKGVEGGKEEVEARGEGRESRRAKGDHETLGERRV